MKYEFSVYFTLWAALQNERGCLLLTKLITSSSSMTLMCSLCFDQELLAFMDICGCVRDL